LSNLRVIYDNAADRATLSSSATQTGLGVSNLLSDVKSKVCRSTGNTLSVYATWPTAETIGGVANAFTNLSPTTTARIRLTNEVAATNLYKYSEQFENSVWVKTACSTIPNTTSAPDGSLNATKIVEDNTNTFREFYQTISVTNGVSYTHSAYMKPAGRRYVQILAQSSFFGSGHVNFDLQTGTITATNTGATGTIEAAPNGYYRISVTMTAIATGTSRISTSIIDTGTAGHAIAYQGDGVSGVYVWGAQIEVGSSRSSYYPSTNTFTSRASTATYIAFDGSMKSAAINVARFTYNQNNLSAPPKLLLEVASTNVVTASGTLTTGWSGCNIAAATGTTYRGFETYQTISKATTSSNECRIQSFGAVAAGSKYTATVALRAGNTTTASCVLYDGAAGGTAFGNSADSVAMILEGPGTIAQIQGGQFTVSGLSATVDTVLQITRTFTAAGTGQVGIYPGGRQSTTSGDSTLATRVQVEAQAWSSSYIPTTTAAVTRSADVSTSAAGNRPLGYIDTWQSYTYDSGSVLFSPAPYKILHGLTQTQAASAYAYGGGKYACFWLPSKVTAYGMAVDITDTNNLQGYVEVSRIICGDYWSPSVVDVQGTSLQVVDTSSHIRTDAGDLYTYVGTKHRKQTINLPSIEATSRKQLWDIMWGNGMSKPIFISTFANSTDTSLEAAHMMYGKLSQTPSMSTPYFNYQAATIEIEEV
jgi:hypothetical protein